MAERLRCVFKTDEIRDRWAGLSKRVGEEFDLLGPGVLCFFDDESVCVSSSERGLFVPDLVNPNNRHCWPQYVRDHMDAADAALIYVPGHVCCRSEQVLFVIALAHEIRHFEQWTREPKTWEMGRKLRENQAFLRLQRTWDIPAEADAIIVSKRVAEKVAGTEEVRKYTRMRMSHGDLEENYWIFFDSILPSQESKWIETTETLHSRLCSLVG
jgi:hypothetical protein